MRRQLAAPETLQRLQQQILAGVLGTTGAGEHIVIVANGGLLFEDRQRRRRQRDPVLAAALHALGRDRP